MTRPNRHTLAFEQMARLFAEVDRLDPIEPQHRGIGRLRTSDAVPRGSVFAISREMTERSLGLARMSDETRRRLNLDADVQFWILLHPQDRAELVDLIAPASGLGVRGFEFVNVDQTIADIAVQAIADQGKREAGQVEALTALRDRLTTQIGTEAPEEVKGHAEE